MKENNSTTRLMLIVGTTLLFIFGLLFLLFRMLEPFIFIILAAFILSVFLNPLFSYFHIKKQLNKKFSALLSLFIFLISISIPISIISTLLVSEISDLLNYIKSNAGIKNELTNAIYAYLSQWGISTQNIESEINSHIIDSLRFLSSNITSVLSRTVLLVLNSLLTLILTFYFLTQKEDIVRYIFSISPLKKADVERLTSRAIEVVAATIRGNLIVISIQAVLGGIGFFIFGISSPILLGIVYGLASLIPAIGISIIWIPVAIYLFLSGNPASALGLVAWCLGSNLLMDNIITPKIVGGATKLHPLLILFGVLGGVQFFGIFGIILGPTIVALSFVALDMYRQLIKE